MTIDNISIRIETQVMVLDWFEWQGLCDPEIRHCSQHLGIP